MSNKITTGQETNQKTLFQDLMTRRVPHILGIYLAASWAVLQFIDWVVNRYILSPHLVDFTLTSIVSFIPSILILAYFHGKPGKDDWTKIEKIGIPINVIISFLILIIFFSPKELGAATETVIIENENGQQIERIIPKADFRKNIAIFSMENKITDPTLNWIGYGITQALGCDLGQEMFISGNDQVHTKLKEKGFYDKIAVPLTLKREISKELHVEYFFGGNVTQDEAGQFIVETFLYRTRDGKVLAKNTFRGSDIFIIIDEISVQIKYDLGIPSAHIENSIDLPVSEITTSSLKAFEYWARGLHNFMGEKYDVGVAFLEKAVGEDEAFAMAYLSLQGFYVMTNQGEKRLGAVTKAMEYLYKIPERFHYIIKVTYFDSTNEPEKYYQAVKMHIKLFPQDILAYEIMAQIYVARGDFEQVIKQYNTILNIDPSRHEYLLIIGKFIQHRLHDNDEALKYYNIYLTHYPENAEAHLLVGKIYKNQNKINRAKESFDTVLIFDPNNIDALLSIIGIDYDGLEQIEKSYDILEMSKNAKDSVRVYEGIESELLEYGRYGESMRNWEIWRKIEMSYAAFYEYGVGQLFYPANYVKINQSDKAFALMDEFKKTYQTPFDGFVNMGYLLIYNELNDGENAAKYLSATIKHAKSIGAIVLLDMIKLSEAKVYRLNGEYDKAIQTINESQRAGDTDSKIELARCFRLKKDFKTARKLLEEACGECDNNANGLYELGILHHAMDDLGIAMQYMNNYIEFYQHADSGMVQLRKAKEYINEWKPQS